MPYAQVHRFHDKVAASISGDRTQYLTPTEARKLARALNKAAKSCKNEPKFSESTCGTFELQFSGEPHK